MKNYILIAALLLMACNTRKKDVQVQHAEMQSEIAVHSEVVARLIDTGLIKTNIAEAFNMETVEVFKYDSAGRITESQKITRTKGQKQTNQVEQKQLAIAANATSDSTGKKHEKQKGKALKVNTSRPPFLPIMGCFLIIAMLIGFLVSIRSKSDPIR